MKYRLSAICMLVIVGFGLSSCNEANGPELNKLVSSPSNVELMISRNTLTVSWEFSNGEPVMYFIAQLSANDEFSPVIQTDTLEPDARELVYENVVVSTDYNFRIKAVTENRARSSRFQTQNLHLGNILQPVENSEVTGSSVALHWTQPATGSVTEIVLTPEEGSPITKQLSDQDRANGSITINNLSSFTLYSVTLYDEDVRRGAVTFRTYDANAMITINNGGTSYRSLQTAIDEAAPNDVIQIKGKHDFQNNGPIAVPKSLTITASPNSSEQPVIYLASFEPTGSIDAFTLSGLKLIGTGNHTVNVSAAETANVTIENCDISGFTSGIFYASSDASTTYSLTVNNSLMHDFGDTGGDFVDMRGGTLTRIELMNSTFWNLGRTFLRIDNGVEYTGNNTETGEQLTGHDSGDPATIHNCTIDNVASEAFVKTPEANAFVVHVNNNILTNLRNEGGGIGVLSNGYANDNNTFGKNSGGWFNGWDFWNHLDFETATNTTSLDPQYADPANGDFTLGNQTLIEAELGDPRWY